MPPDSRLARRPANRPEVNELEDLPDPSPAAPQEEAEQAGHKVDVLADGQVGKEAEELGHVTDPLASAPAEVSAILAQDARLPRAWGQRSRQDPDGGRLAGAAGSDDAKDRALRHGQRDVLQGHDVAKRPAQIVRLDRRRRIAGRLPS